MITQTSKFQVSIINMTKENLSSNFKLRKIDETRNYFIKKKKKKKKCFNN